MVFPKSQLELVGCLKMLPNHQFHGGCGDHELPMYSWNPASSFLCSPPLSPLKFPQASRFPSDKKLGLSAGHAVQTNFHALPQDATGCNIPSLPLASGSPNKSLSPSGCATDPNASDLKANALPTPRPSLELPQRSHLLSLSEVISKIKPPP